MQAVYEATCKIYDAVLATVGGPRLDCAQMLPAVPPPMELARSCAWLRPDPGNHTRKPQALHIVGGGARRDGAGLGGGPMGGGGRRWRDRELAMERGEDVLQDNGTAGEGGGTSPAQLDEPTAAECLRSEATAKDNAKMLDMAAIVAVASLAVNGCLLLLLLHRCCSAKNLKDRVELIRTTPRGRFPGRMPVIGRSEDPAYISDTHLRV